MIPFTVRISVAVDSEGSRFSSKTGPMVEKYVLGTPSEKYEFRLGVEQIVAVLKSLEEIDCHFHIGGRIFNSHYSDLVGTISVWSEDLKPIAEKAVIELSRIAKKMTKQDVRSSVVFSYSIYRERTAAA